ncbi:MAG TPA: cysteine dioxygenase family protein, partial [Acidimicrobiia bacterium]
ERPTMHTSLTAGRLSDIARELADSPETWWPHVRRDSGKRWYVSLLEENDFEAWLLGWPEGEGIELHDHGSSSGAIAVLEGTLLETYIEASDWVRPSGRLCHRQLPKGALVSFEPDHIHDVVNGGARQALSIHVYSPRLRSMTFYENRPDRGLAAVRTEVARPDLVLV